ncbi:signal transduction histidine kinase [Clostridium tetanomorphum]|uniref:sensor histidine kinase n=1 Tax=Clostridium tetanomorphum TaxID=1553 RepID=UPI0004508DF1|nr:HAMP domain-containing sensor histidine kinase [Clostridium tetanomorphum]KAJ50601.1 alkaline phosphatase synthesis sensor protein phoR [Clostridium tetanomorphum DSM 665]MBP1862676.1 signal transduction histidine kinase [Clostridium tetanomorphum]NRS85484.1 signal transduction histidine kinase [Clostridium tetanomorphum]SQC02798.1 alkaline phosphatase synthesis sensor protein phoR [Clostridium tetanomorphum]
MKSIKKRLLTNFMLIIVTSVMAFEIILINFIKRYYYNNAEEILSNQIMISSDFYYRYFSNNSLEENVMDNVDVFWKQTQAQVQIINKDGKVLMDSIGIKPKEAINTNDFKKALNGEKGKWIGNVDYDDARVMAIAYPLKSDGNIVGVLRYISSLKEVDRAVRKVSLLFLTIGTIVIIIVGIFSIFLANSIIGPIKQLTNTAEKMANGDLKVRNNKVVDDEIGKLSDTLNYMAEEILKKDQLKNEFISSVSHELRTPLTAIKGWAITLNTDNLDDENLIRDGLKIIENESDRLSSMVEELLDFSKLISGKVTIKKEKVDLKCIIDYIEKYLGPRAKREKIDFIVEYNYDISQIFIDSNRIKQVLINILDNAFKFLKDDGERKVLLKVQREDNYLVILIKDNGTGISKEDLPKVKEKFYKGKSSKSQNGIGLSICDEIIKMHNGFFNIESELNVGTTVYIKLPNS